MDARTVQFDAARALLTKLVCVSAIQKCAHVTTNTGARASIFTDDVSTNIIF